MVISKEKADALKKRMEQLGIREEELEEKFVLGSGRGGQKINKTSSTVYLKHPPSGIEVKCGKDRLRETNRFFARRELCDRFEKQAFGTKTKKELTLEKIKKQKARRARRQRKDSSLLSE